MNRYWPGNRITLLRSGAEFFPALLAEIAAAEREVWLETYIYADDETARRVSDALIAVAQRGVLVRVMVDGWGARHYLTRRVERYLEAGGVRLLKYRPRTPVTDPRGYLFQTARHVLITANQAVRQDHERYLACDANDLALRAEAVPSLWVEEEGGAELAFEEFERVLSELPEKCQAALLRQRRDGWSYQQIASELQVSVNTVKDYIVRALEHFQVHFSMPAKERSALKDRS